METSQGNSPEELQLETVVKELLAPLVAKDGGEIEWLRLRAGVAELHLGRSCAGCPGQHFTLQMVVLPALRAAVPSVRSVRVVPKF